MKHVSITDPGGVRDQGSIGPFMVKASIVDMNEIYIFEVNKVKLYVVATWVDHPHRSFDNCRGQGVAFRRVIMG